MVKKLALLLAVVSLAVGGMVLVRAWQVDRRNQRVEKPVADSMAPETSAGGQGSGALPDIVQNVFEVDLIAEATVLNSVIERLPLPGEITQSNEFRQDTILGRITNPNAAVQKTNLRIKRVIYRSPEPFGFRNADAVSIRSYLSFASPHEIDARLTLYRQKQENRAVELEAPVIQDMHFDDQNGKDFVFFLFKYNTRPPLAENEFMDWMPYHSFAVTDNTINHPKSGVLTIDELEGAIKTAAAGPKPANVTVRGFSGRMALPPSIPGL